MSTKKEIKVFSENFKRAKVAEIEEGKMTRSQVSKEFDVSYVAVGKWVKKYGKLPQKTRLVIETDSDYLKLVEVTKQKENLERIIGKQQIRLDFYEELLKVVKEHYGEDPIDKSLKK